jgi:hypothetical protein
MKIMHYKACTFTHFCKLKLFLPLKMLSPTQLKLLSPLPPTRQYASLANIKATLQVHACKNGYAIANNCSTAKKAA